MQFIDPHLPRSIFGWHSPRLGRDMPIVSYGHAGHPLLIFPTAQADFLENERFFLIKAIEPFNRYLPVEDPARIDIYLEAAANPEYRKRKAEHRAQYG